jgi:hypothetical protein
MLGTRYSSTLARKFLAYQPELYNVLYIWKCQRLA